MKLILFYPKYITKSVLMARHIRVRSGNNIIKNSQLEVSHKNGVLENVAKFIGKYL